MTQQPLNEQAPNVKRQIEHARISGCTYVICFWSYIGLEVTNKRRFHKFSLYTPLLQPPLFQVYLNNQAGNGKSNKTFE